MTRTLPWLKENGGNASTKGSRVVKTGPQLSVNSPKRKRPSTSSDVGNEYNTTGVSTPERKTRHRLVRTPSSSPPPAAPEQEPMKEGYTADDAWIMVEDEFLSTAQLFTQHLHRAEYSRLRKLANDRDTSIIVRPVDASKPMPASTRRDLERKLQDMKSTAALQSVTGRSDQKEDNDDPWMQDPHLGSLMDSPKKPSRVLKQAIITKSNTRASVGFARTSEGSPSKPTKIKPLHPSSTTKTKQSPPEPLKASSHDYDNNETRVSDEHDTDDLDGPIQPSVKHEKIVSPTIVKPRMTTSEVRPKTTDLGNNIFKRFSKSGKSDQPPVIHRQSVADVLPAVAASVTRIRRTERPTSRPGTSTHTRTSFKFDSFEDEHAAPAQRSQAAAILTKRKAKLAKKEVTARSEKKEDTGTTAEIPTFLF